jgi:hypothetical protein
MRCKCGFNSFEHHLVCPKCHRDLTATRRLLNLDIPAPGALDFFQIAGQRMAVPRPFLGSAAADGITPAPLADEGMSEIGMTDGLEIDRPGGRPRPETTLVKPWPPHRAAMDQIKSALTETGDLNPEAESYSPGGRDGIPAAPASTQVDEPDEEDDLSSLIGGLNLDDLEGEL